MHGIRPLLVSTLALLPLATGGTRAPDEVIVEVHAPPRFRNAAFELRAGDASVRSVFDSDALGDVAFAKVALAVPRRATVTLSLAILDRYDAPPPWTVRTTLNGSGRLTWTLNREKPEGSVSQWPSVTWAATGGKLDVAVDGHVTGTTTTSDGIQPDREHAVVWERPGGRPAAVCRRTVRLPANVERTYTCDVRSRTVAEE